MNKNYNKFFNKNENVIPESEVEIKEIPEVETKEELKECCDSETCEPSSQPEPEVENKDRQVGNCEYLNLRVAPNKQSEVLSIIKKGTTLTLLEPISDNNEWVKVKIHKTGVEGFIMRDYTI